jgi:hypothetical protein
MTRAWPDENGVRNGHVRPLTRELDRCITLRSSS